MAIIVLPVVAAGKSLLIPWKMSVYSVCVAFVNRRNGRAVLLLTFPCVVFDKNKRAMEKATHVMIGT